MALSENVLRALDRLRFEATNAFQLISSCVCAPSSNIKINGRTFKIIKSLGEGGFSYVYLAQDEHSGREFALKKIRCPNGSDGVKQAMREVEAYRRFKHKNIIRILDSAVVQDAEGDGQIVYLFLPVYRKGNLQDAINVHYTAGTHFSEKEILRLFKGTCDAVAAMHDYHTGGGGPQNAPAAPQPQPSGSRPAPNEEEEEDEDEEDEDEDEDEDEEDDDAKTNQGPSVPLVAQRKVEHGETIFDGDEELGHDNGQAGGKVEHVPYAHRDLKPGNVMIADDGVTPILMDFGSAMRARVKIENRNQALLQQDIAAEHSTMAYRAPELFDVNTGITLDEKVDIWSLGCVLFALAYLHSPFENLQTTEQGGSIAMAVQSAKYKHPSSGYSAGFKALIDSMLKVDPKDRPDIHKVLNMTQTLMASTR